MSVNLADRVRLWARFTNSGKSVSRIHSTLVSEISFKPRFIWRPSHQQSFDANREVEYIIAYIVCAWTSGNRTRLFDSPNRTRLASCAGLNRCWLELWVSRNPKKFRPPVVELLVDDGDPDTARESSYTHAVGARGRLHAPECVRRQFGFQRRFDWSADRPKFLASLSSETMCSDKHDMHTSGDRRRSMLRRRGDA